MWTESLTKTIQEQFVAVAVAGHVANGRKDADGEFLRATGIRLAGAGGNLECLTASGIRLGSLYAAGGTQVNEREIQQTLKQFRELPDDERLPGAVKVPEQGPIADNVLAIQPPQGALILKTHHRVLTRDDDGGVKKTTVLDYPPAARLGAGDSWITFYGERWEAQPDRMWILESEWKAIVRPDPKPGDRYPLLDSVADRMTRAHLIAGMAYGECGICNPTEVRSRSMTLTVTDVTASEVQLRLDGAAKLGAGFETSEAEDKKGAEQGQSVQGFEPQALGYLTFDRKAHVFTRFDVVALGDAYGTPSGAYFFYYRPGKYPIGISLELCSGKSPADRIPPRAAVIYDTPNPAYLATGSK